MTPLIEMIRSGLALVPILQGKKKPISKGWNDLNNLITTPSELSKLSASNLGLADPQCSPLTCAIPTGWAKHLTEAKE